MFISEGRCWCGQRQEHVHHPTLRRNTGPSPRPDTGSTVPEGCRRPAATPTHARPSETDLRRWFGCCFYRRREFSRRRRQQDLWARSERDVLFPKAFWLVTFSCAVRSFFGPSLLRPVYIRDVGFLRMQYNTMHIGVISGGTDGSGPPLFGAGERTP